MSPDPRSISIENYTYELPSERIALHPLPERDSSKLLIYRQGKIQTSQFRLIDEQLAGPALMIFNNTRVVQARLLFQKSTGAGIEIFCLEPAGKNTLIQLAFEERRESSWFCLVGNSKKWKTDDLEMAVGDEIVLKASKGEKKKDGFVIHFSWDSEHSFAEVLDIAGKTPLPPYLRRKAESADKTRYQTVYARHSGSVAAPTAGLHFTDAVVGRLMKQNIEKEYVTLHVGAGTFKPVSAETLQNHIMHREQVIITSQTIEKLMEFSSKSIISVGTTSMRTIESLYWLGLKLKLGYTPPSDGFYIDQWEPYENRQTSLVDSKEALQSILNYMEEQSLQQIHGETSLIIAPGYSFKLVDTLITNFHQPGSTLLLLVAAFVGLGWQNIYQYALENDFRFLSYGDSCLLFRKK